MGTSESFSMNSNVSFPESDCSDSELEAVSSLSDDIVSSSSLPTSLSLSQTDRQRRSGIGVFKLGFFSFGVFQWKRVTQLQNWGSGFSGER